MKGGADVSENLVSVCSWNCVYFPGLCVALSNDSPKCNKAGEAYCVSYLAREMIQFTFLVVRSRSFRDYSARNCAEVEIITFDKLNYN